MMRSSFSTNLFTNDDSVNPMDGVSNMSDAMLVLAVGIMLALVINWKIDIGKFNSNVKIDTKKMEEFDQDAAKLTNDVSLDDIESNYVKTGTVYQDIDTGRTFVVIDGQ
ncbi:MAG: DUF2149 domain-containing protein [Lachnospiraceae bacterium]|nr:DUF2149 domain-containing protein [Lachnospiraceae bacterium]